jgi:hypothetical protein
VGPAPAQPGTASHAVGVVCLLTTTEDRPADWGNGGQVLHSQPLELSWLREFVRTRFCDGAYPQLVLRLGTIIQASVGVRRPVASVLFASGSLYRGISHV